MNGADRIRRAYAEAAAHFGRILADAANSGDAAYAELADLARLNDYAYFVLFWGQFEPLVNELAQQIDGESALEIGFMPRFRLCVPARHPYHEDVDLFYSWRCELAHGRLKDFPDLVPPEIFDRLEEIAEELAKGPLTGDPMARFDF